MPEDQVYLVTAPDGTKLRVTGPAGASQDQVIAQAQRLYQPKAAVPAMDPNAAIKRQQQLNYPSAAERGQAPGSTIGEGGLWEGVKRGAEGLLGLPGALVGWNDPDSLVGMMAGAKPPDLGTEVERFKANTAREAAERRQDSSFTVNPNAMRTGINVAGSAVPGGSPAPLINRAVEGDPLGAAAEAGMMLGPPLLLAKGIGAAAERAPAMAEPLINNAAALRDAAMSSRGPTAVPTTVPSAALQGVRAVASPMLRGAAAIEEAVARRLASGDATPEFDLPQSGPPALLPPSPAIEAANLADRNAAAWENAPQGFEPRRSTGTAVNIPFEEPFDPDQAPFGLQMKPKPSGTGEPISFQPPADPLDYPAQFEMKPPAGPARTIPFEEPFDPETAPFGFEMREKPTGPTEIPFEMPAEESALKPSDLTNVERGIAPLGNRAKQSTIRNVKELVQEIPEITDAPRGQFDKVLMEGFKRAEDRVIAEENAVPRSTTIQKQPIIDQLQAIADEYEERGLAKSEAKVKRLLEDWKEQPDSIPWEQFRDRKRAFFKESGSNDAAFRRSYRVLMDAASTAGEGLAKANRSYSIIRRAIENAGIDLASGRRIRSIGKERKLPKMEPGQKRSPKFPL